jgi:hypothetical protein
MMRAQDKSGIIRDLTGKRLIPAAGWLLSAKQSDRQVY